MDFPDFVGDLINGIYDAIVDASIQQMEAYGELAGSVAKTIDDFRRDTLLGSVRPRLGMLPQGHRAILGTPLK